MDVTVHIKRLGVTSLKKKFLLLVSCEN